MVLIAQLLLIVIVLVINVRVDFVLSLLKANVQLLEGVGQLVIVQILRVHQQQLQIQRLLLDQMLLVMKLQQHPRLQVESVLHLNYGIVIIKETVHYLEVIGVHIQEDMHLVSLLLVLYAVLHKRGIVILKQNVQEQKVIGVIITAHHIHALFAVLHKHGIVILKQNVLVQEHSGVELIAHLLALYVHLHNMGIVMIKQAAQEQEHNGALALELILIVHLPVLYVLHLNYGVVMIQQVVQEQEEVGAKQIMEQLIASQEPVQHILAA